MLERLDLEHFKCFRQLYLPLGALTLLSGSNASGKSSILQSLALLHQTMREHEWSTSLMLNGSTIKLGTALDVIDEVHGRQTFSIGILDGNSTTHYRWTFAGERSDMSMKIENVSINKESRANRPETLRHLLPFQVGTHPPSLITRLCGLTYITAERVGPREVYTLEDRQTAPVVGPAGEHAVSVLHCGRDEHVLPELALEGMAPTRLRQVEARMRQFFPGCGLALQQVPQANAVTLGLRTSPDTDFHRPIHVGFGLTQVLPIVVAALSAVKEDILLIENPEVHLHPAGQALMGQFLADVARAGIQVIVETHSDHVLNGIRRSVKAARLKPAQVALHFFRPRYTERDQTEKDQFVSPQLDSSGNIDSWPEGFFDQFDKDMNHFAGWGG